MLLQDIEKSHTIAEWKAHYRELCRSGLVDGYQPTGNTVADENAIETASLIYAARKARRGLVIGSKEALAFLLKRYFYRQV